MVILTYLNFGMYMPTHLYHVIYLMHLHIGIENGITSITAQQLIFYIQSLMYIDKSCGQISVGRAIHAITAVLES